MGLNKSAPGDGFEEIHAGLVRRNYGEAGAVIPKQLRRLTILLARLNLGDLLFEMAVRCEQIEPPVEIVVEEEQAELEQ